MKYLSIVRRIQVIDGQLSAEGHVRLLEAAADVRTYCDRFGRGVLILAGDDEASRRSAQVLSNLLAAKVEEVESLWKGDSRSNLRHVFRAVRSRERLCHVLVLVAPEESTQDFALFYKVKSKNKNITPVRIMYANT